MITRIITLAVVVWMETIRKKDVYVLLILLGSLLLTLLSLNIFGLGDAVRYIKDIGLLFAWLFSWILSVNTSTMAIPGEEKTGTIFSLLAKPVTRTEVIIGKWLGTSTIVAFATLTFYLLLIMMTYNKGATYDWFAMMQGYTLHCMAIGIICSIGLAFSTKMNHDAAASLTGIITGASFLIVPRIPALLAKESGWHSDALLILYNLLPHFEVLDMRKRIVHDYGPVALKFFLIATLYGILISVFFLVLASMSYRRKKFSREYL